MSDHAEASPTDTAIYCRMCGDRLAKSAPAPAQCSACGLRFCVDDPTTFSSDPTQTRKAEFLLALLKMWHRLFVRCCFVLIVVMLFQSEPLVLVVFGGLLLTMIALLVVQIRLTFTVFGMRYAVGHVMVELVLLPLFLIGFIVVPLLVIREIERRWHLEKREVSIW